LRGHLRPCRSSIIGQFFSGLVIGLVIGYSICDKGKMLTVVWTRAHPYIDVAFARLILLAGLKPEDYHERDQARLSSEGPPSAKVTNLKDAQQTSRRKRARHSDLPNSWGRFPSTARDCVVSVMGSNALLVAAEVAASSGWVDFVVNARYECARRRIA
jgi:hypothetical protein